MEALYQLFFIRGSNLISCRVTFFILSPHPPISLSNFYNMTIELKKKGYSTKEISQQLNIPLKTVYRWLNQESKK
ncbi:helix-turn-helix domain-containing protein [Candidatus Bathyarchaeota archaeon]|nr:helix-turn-helix domain-containing protein [Candidatus Bathyarchaeota archaeon]